MATVGEEPNFEVVQILVEILGQLEEMNGLADLSDSTSEDGSSVEEAEDVEMKVVIDTILQAEEELERKYFQELLWPHNVCHSCSYYQCNPVCHLPMPVFTGDEAAAVLREIEKERRAPVYPSIWSNVNLVMPSEVPLEICQPTNPVTPPLPTQVMVVSQLPEFAVIRFLNGYWGWCVSSSIRDKDPKPGSLVWVEWTEGPPKKMYRVKLMALVDTLQQANRLVDSRTEQLKLMDRLNGRPSRPIGKDIRTIERLYALPQEKKMAKTNQISDIKETLVDVNRQFRNTLKSDSNVETPPSASSSSTNTSGTSDSVRFTAFRQTFKNKLVRRHGGRRVWERPKLRQKVSTPSLTKLAEIWATAGAKPKFKPNILLKQ